MKKIKRMFTGYILIGLALALASLIIYGFDFDALYADMTQEKYYTQVIRGLDEIGENKSEISIDVDNLQISVKASSDGEFSLSYWKHSKYSIITESFEDGKVNLKIKEKFHFAINSFVVSKYSKLELLVPTDFAGTIKLVSHNGDVKLNGEGLTGIEILNVTTNNGNTVVEKLAGVNELNMKTNNGGVTVKDCQGNKLNMKSDNGSIWVGSGSTFNEVTSTTSNGNNSIRIVGIESEYKIILVTHNGDSKVDGQKRSGTSNSAMTNFVKLTSHNGNNRLWFVSA